VFVPIGRNWKRWLVPLLQGHWMICALSAVLAPDTSTQLLPVGVLIE
jgi:hypothetical protein